MSFNTFLIHSNGRTILVDEAADKGYLVAHTHAPFPGLGHVRRDGASYRWVPAPYVDDAKRK
ncbi:hypothetical protein WME95_38595 [Sorangium sp. So ce327]|uniref:hypothetical protein n=1 Tax=Sorangium sp. So ce327 TaxID=3133301 RepID=UPI003F5E1042